MIDNLIFYGTLAIIAVVTFFCLAIIIQLSVRIFRFTLERVYWHRCKTIEQKWQFFEWKEHISLGDYPPELIKWLEGSAIENENEIKKRYEHYLLGHSDIFMKELFSLYLYTQGEYKDKLIRLEAEISDPQKLKDELKALYEKYNDLIRTRNYYVYADENNLCETISGNMVVSGEEHWLRSRIIYLYNIDKNPAFRDYIHSVWQAHGYLKQHWFI